MSTLDEIELVAATRGPGLVAALLVGFSAAKALAASRRLPFAAVDHLHGHLAAGFLRADGSEPFEPPFLCLIASGGHTLLVDVRDHGPGMRILGQTLDDAAGEAFDKGARLLGLGYPGGAALERLAREGDADAFEFPAGARMPGLDFSFAGLKTALLYRVRDLGEEQSVRRRADLAAAYQRAIVEALMIRVRRALAQTGRSGWRSAVASRRTGRCARPRRAGGRARHPAARPLYRQRGDDRQRGAVRAGAPVPRVSEPRRLRQRRATAGRRGRLASEWSIRRCGR